MDKNERKRGAIWGQLIGDAMALGTHWIYSAGKMRDEYPEVKGFETPKPSHYHEGKPVGSSTHLGEGCRLMLQSMVACKKFDAADFSKRFRDFFGSPSYKGYIDRPTRATLDNMDRNVTPPGADDDQTPTADRLAPLIAFYLDNPELEKKVVEATEIVQNNPKTIAYMKCNARILSHLMQGRPLRETFEKETSDPVAGNGIRAALDFQGSEEEAKRKFGLACYLNEAFPLSVYFALSHGGSFEKALLANTRAGGDNAGRGGMLGAWLGAYQGMSAIPKNWIHLIIDKDKIISLIDELISISCK